MQKDGLNVRDINSIIADSNLIKLKKTAAICTCKNVNSRAVPF